MNGLESIVAAGMLPNLYANRLERLVRNRWKNTITLGLNSSKRHGLFRMSVELPSGFARVLEVTVKDVTVKEVKNAG